MLEATADCGESVNFDVLMKPSVRTLEVTAGISSDWRREVFEDSFAIEEVELQNRCWLFHLTFDFVIELGWVASTSDVKRAARPAAIMIDAHSPLTNC